MKKGVIVYVTHAEEEIPLQGGTESLIRFLQRKGITTVFMASSEEDVVQGWFHLVTHGMNEVSLLTVGFNTATDSFESRGTLRLCG